LKIVVDKPPNWDELNAVFGLETKRGLLYAFGDILYNPDGIAVSPPIMAHEEVHKDQQGNDIEGWWQRYIVDINFRLNQELEAHRREWKVYKQMVKDRNYRSAYLSYISSRLASSLYGNVVTSKDAKQLIKGTL
jgi:hypothetical protein